VTGDVQSSANTAHRRDREQQARDQAAHHLHAEPQQLAHSTTIRRCRHRHWQV
jgi:hypothetical protein